MSSVRSVSYIETIKNEKTIQVLKFNINQIKENSNIVAVGKAKVGKTTLFANILEEMYSKMTEYPPTIIFCGSQSDMDIYEFTFNKLNLRFAYIVTTDIYRIEKEINDFDKNFPKQNWTIVLDSIPITKELLKLSRITEAFKGNDLLMYTMQYPLGIDPWYRTNYDYVFLFTDCNNGNKKKMYENYAGFYNNYSTFERIFHKITEYKGECLVLNNYGREYWYSTKLIEKSETNEWVNEPMCYATQKNNLELVKLLLKQNPDLSYQNGNHLNYASLYSSLEIVELLLKNKAKLGEFTLINACINGNAKMIDLILKNANEEYLNKYRIIRTIEECIRTTKGKSSIELLEVLKNNGVKFDIDTGLGETPVEIALKSGKIDVVNYLVRNGAKIPDSIKS